MQLFQSASKMNWEQIMFKLHESDITVFGHQFPINLLTMAAPIMLLCVLAEYMYSKKKNLGLYSTDGLIGSIGVGLGYLIATALVNVLTFYIVWWCYYYLAPIQLPYTWWSFILCMFVYDFARYWAHRLAHEQRFWWASHVTHHSSDHYNLTVSFRLCWVDQIKLVFFIPVVVIGFDPLMFFLVHQIGILYQFWQHSDVIPPLPKFLEAIFVTPTNHKVHHGKNETYIDVNYGSMFIFWDKLFGTYKAPGERPEWGVKQPLSSTKNPFYLVFHEYIDIVRDFFHAKTLKDKWKATFGRPGEYEGVEKF